MEGGSAASSLGEEAGGGGGGAGDGLRDEEEGGEDDDGAASDALPLRSLERLLPEDGAEAAPSPAEAEGDVEEVEEGFLLEWLSLASLPAGGDRFSLVRSARVSFSRRLSVDD